MTDFGRRPKACPANVLPKTGQTTSYRDGDDGDYEAGWEGDRFTNNGDGTITDNATGLMWPADWTGDGGNNGTGEGWNDAIDWANALSFAGHDDWKLPSLFEFISLWDCELSNPNIPAVFTAGPVADFWTSTTRPDLTSSASVASTLNQTCFFIGGFIRNRVVACREA